MRIKGAMTVLNKRADFYGKSLDWLINEMDNGGTINETTMVLVAYEVYKKDQGYRWKGTEGDTWVRVTNEEIWA
tara:strand:+ start:183 stop:404 length:222 start_codon:yes stop_codon:yes gene_type:complete